MSSGRTRRPPTAALLVALVLAACAHAPAAPPASAASVVISLEDIDCQSCGASAVNVLEAQDGVYDAAFAVTPAELTVSYDGARTTPAALLAVVTGLGHKAELGAGKGRYLATDEATEGLDIVWLSREGQAVDLDAHRVPGKVVVFDFYADWCGPCREVDAELRTIMKAQPDVAMRKLDVVDWESEVARKLLQGVPSLPYVIVVSKAGARVDAISGLDLPRLRRAIDAARAP